MDFSLFERKGKTLNVSFTFTGRPYKSDRSGKEKALYFVTLEATLANNGATWTFKDEQFGSTNRTKADGSFHQYYSPNLTIQYLAYEVKGVLQKTRKQAVNNTNKS